MAFVSPSGWMKTANVLPLIALRRDEMINVWPLPLEPWLPASERRAVRLPPASTICPPYGHDAQLPLQLTGVRDGAIIKRLPGAAEATLPLQSSGGAGERWWFLNGEPLTERGRNVTLHLTDKGVINCW